MTDQWKDRIIRGGAITVMTVAALGCMVWPKQLSGLCWAECGDLAFKRPARTKILPVCRAQNHSSKLNPHAYLKIQATAGERVLVDQDAQRS